MAFYTSPATIPKVVVAENAENLGRWADISSGSPSTSMYQYSFRTGKEERLQGLKKVIIGRAMISLPKPQSVS